MKSRLLFCAFLLLSTYGYSQNCNISLSVSPANPVICEGAAVPVTATATGGTAPYSYGWSTGETSQSISINKAGNYTVKVQDAAGCGKFINFVVTSSSAPPLPTAASQTVCENSSATLVATAPGGTYQWFDAPTGGNFLASGASYTTPPITTNTTFYVQTTVNTCTSGRSAVNVFVFSRPTVTGGTTCAGNVVTLSASGGDSYQWYASSSGGSVLSTSADFTTPPLNATTTYYVVATANGCSSPRTPVVAKVTPKPPPPTATGPGGVCSGQTANLHATGTGGVIDWFTTSTGGTSLISSPDFTTPPLSQTTTYYAQVTAGNDCISDRTPVTVTVNSAPPAPVVSNTTTCNGTKATFTINGSGNYQWYNLPSGGILLATGNSFTTPVLNSTTTYYVEDNNGGCVSPRSAATVTVGPAPPGPTASGQIICKGSQAVLTATAGAGATFKWYDAPTAGNLLASTATYTTLNLNSNTTYYVEDNTSGCISQRSSVTVTVTSPPPAPTASGTTLICYGTSATLSANGNSGQYEWYDAPTGGNLLSNSQVYFSPALFANTTYYVDVIAGNCASARTAITVVVNPLQTTPTVSGTTSICTGTQASLTASGPGTMEWYDAASGGNLLFTGNNFTTPVLSAATTYYVEATATGNNTCNSKRKAVTVTIISEGSPPFQYPSGTICSSGPNQTPVINDPAGGTFSSSPAGLVFVSTTTGQINVAASALGNYTISFTSKGTCGGTSTARVSIVTNPDATFSYNGSPYCNDASNPVPTFPPGASGGTFTASSPRLAFANTSTGAIDLSKSLAGTYTVTNTITAAGGCPGAQATSTVTIAQAAVVNAGPPQTVVRGNPVQLAATVSGVAGGTWSGGQGTFNNTSALNAVYTPKANENVVTLTFTSSNPGAPCGPGSSTVVISIVNSAPAAPTTGGNTSVCSGSATTLVATAPGGKYTWYDASTGGNLLTSGAAFTTPALTVPTTYYVETTINGVESSRTAVTVAIDPIPAAPTANPQSTCMNSSATLLASGSNGTYQWYDAPSGGNLVSNTATYVTPNLSSDITYYVQTTIKNCPSARTAVPVTVTPAPAITSSSVAAVCSGTPLSYTITANITPATFNWSRAVVAGISNAAVSNQTSANINETLQNTTANTIVVHYSITPTANTCPGTPFDYQVTVYPAPTVTSAPSTTVCNGTSTDYSVAFNIPGTTFSWSRAAVPGITNAAVTGQAAGTIREQLFNNTTAPVQTTYVFNYETPTLCSGIPFNYVVTVNPKIKIISPSTDTVCSGTPQSYVITSNVPTATFNWSRAAVVGISNPAVSNQTSGTISETLVNTTFKPVKVFYNITPTAFTCPDSTFIDTVLVEPKPVKPPANSTSPVCLNSTVQLFTSGVARASYLWTGPNSFTSNSQNPTINNVTQANAGVYKLFVIVNGCPSPAALDTVVVDTLPVAHAGNDTSLCKTATSIQLAGSVTGGTTTGVWSGGSDNFLPGTNALNAQYVFSAADKAAGSVKLTLMSTSKDNCAVSTSTITIKFTLLPSVVAGNRQQVCSQVSSVLLSGTALIPGITTKWTSSGSGNFIPSASQLNAQYVPTAADIAAGSVLLTLTATNASSCYISTDTVTIRFIPPPTVNAGGTKYVLKGHTVVLTPTVSDNNVTYLWSPNVDISDVTAKNPVVTGNVDQTYTLTVTDSRGCTATDQAFIKVSPTISVPNTFTPNSDGINDFWDIQGLIAYTEATVDIFNRYGAKLYHSIGYGKPWDGTYNGKPVPVGVYYYVIDTKIDGQVFTGNVTVIR